MLPALLVLLQSAGSIVSPSPAPTPSPSPSPADTESMIPGLDALRSVAAETMNPDTVTNCLPTDFSVCGVTVRLTDNLRLGQVLDLVLGTPLRVLLIIVIGVLLRRGLHQLIDRLSERIATGPTAVGPPPAAPAPAVPPAPDPAPADSTPAPVSPPPDSPSADPTEVTTAVAATGSAIAATGPDGPAPSLTPAPTTRPAQVPAAQVLLPPQLTTRRQARSRTLAQVLRSLTTIGLTVVVALMVLQELGFSVAPLLSIAGVFGVALGFGAQSLVRDVVSGMFMIVEDQYGVGDVVDVGAASGSVEAVGLRITRLRDVNGTVWYVRNGEILRVGNQSQGWSRAVLDVNIGYNEDLDRAQEVLLEVAQGLRSDERFAAFVIDEPEVWGVEALTTEGVLMRLVVKTLPMQQWAVARELRRRIKQRFDSENIEMRTMPRTVIVNGEDEEAAPRRSADLEP